MRILSWLWMTAVVTMLMARAVFAGPIPPSPAPPSFGESDLTSFTTPGSVVRVDWMVIDASGFGFPGLFAYLYQVENVSGIDLDLFTVTFPAGVVPVDEVVSAGIFTTDDLDEETSYHPPHDISGEISEPTLGNAPKNVSIDVMGGFVSNISWTWVIEPQSYDLLKTGTESPTLYFICSFPPTYGVGGANNSTPPSPWNSLATGGQPVPVPSPEPATVLLLIGALMTGAIVCRRRMTK